MRDLSRERNLQWYDIPLSTKWWLFSGVVAILIGSLVIQTVVDILYARAATPSYAFSKRFGHANYFNNVTGSGLVSASDGGFILIADWRVMKLTSTGEKVFTIAQCDLVLHENCTLNPYTIAAGVSGEFYVADDPNLDGSRRVQKFSADGQYISTLSSYGAASGQINTLDSMVVDAAGNIYVADHGIAGSSNQWDLRIQKFDKDGVFQWRTDASKSSPGQLFNWTISSLAVSGDGMLYAADTYKVLKFDLDGNYISQFGVTGSLQNQLYNPDRVAVGSNGTVAVYVRSKQVKYFNSSATYLGATAVSELGTSTPSILATSGGFYLLTSKEIRKANETGANDLVLAGAGGSSLMTPTDITTDSSGNVYVHDSRNGRIQKFSTEGDLLLTIPLKQNVADSGGYGSVAVDNTGAIYASAYSAQICGSVTFCVLKFGPSGNFIAQIMNNVRVGALVTDGVGRLYAIPEAVYGNGTIGIYDLNGTLLSSFGEYGTGDGKLSGGLRGALYADGKLWLAFSNSYHVQQFNPDGGFIQKTTIPTFYDNLSFVRGGNGDVYVNAKTDIYRYSASGALLGSFKTDTPVYKMAIGAQDSLYALELDNYSNLNSTIGKYDVVMVHAPAAPPSVTVSDITETSATINWTYPSTDMTSPIDGQTVAVYGEGPGGGTQSFNGPETSLAFTNLRPGTTYTVEVTLRNVDGAGPATTTTFTTAGEWNVPAKEVVLVTFSDVGGEKVATVAGANLVGGEDPGEWILALDHSFVKFNGADLPFCSQGLGISAQTMIDMYSSYYPNIAQLVSDTPPCYELIKDNQVAITPSQAVIHLPDNFDTAAQGTVSVNGSPTFTFNKRPNATPTAVVNGTKPIAEHPKVPKLPVFSGMATPAAVVTVTVHSDPVVCTATADAQGAWSCTLPSELPDGEHTVNIHVVNPDSSTVDMGPYPITVGEIATAPVIPITDTRAVVAKIKEVQQKQEEAKESSDQNAGSGDDSTGGDKSSPDAPDDSSNPVSTDKQDGRGEDAKASNPWAAWGIALAAFLGVAVTFFIIWLVKRRKKSDDNTNQPSQL